MSEPVQLHADLVRDVLRDVLGARPCVEVRQWYVRENSYVVVSAETHRPKQRLIVKLELPDAGRNHRFESVAAIAGLVRARTAVPTFDVIAVDVTRSRWPCAVLIVTELRGSTLAQLYPELSSEARAAAQLQVGRAAAQLHALAFDRFGAINPSGSAIDSGGAVDALRLWSVRRIRTPVHRELVLNLFQTRVDAFASVHGPRLTHEDMNPNNLLFEMRDDQPVLTGVLDFEAAWAGISESDLARLELWRLTRGESLRAGYAEIADVPDDLRTQKADPPAAVVSRVCGRAPLGRPSAGYGPGVRRARHHANHAARCLIQKALSEPDPFSWEGEFFQYPRVSVWPRPVQQPFPPMYFSSNSFDSAMFAAANRLGVCLFFIPFARYR